MSDRSGEDCNTGLLLSIETLIGKSEFHRDPEEVKRIVRTCAAGACGKEREMEFISLLFWSPMLWCVAGLWLSASAFAFAAFATPRSGISDEEARRMTVGLLSISSGMMLFGLGMAAVP